MNQRFVSQGTDVLYQAGLRKQLPPMNFIFFSGVVICGLRYSMICWQNAILSDILCATPRCALNISILYIFFVSRNVKHVIILIAQIMFY